MKKQAGVWLVVGFLALAVAIVVVLSRSAPNAEEFAVANQPSPGAKAPLLATNPGKAGESLSPDWSQANPYEFIDPVPVGKPAPNFQQTAANGKKLALSDFKGKKNVVLIFYQGSFCSVCGAQLSNLQKHLEDFKKQDAEIIAISADDLAHARQSLGERGLSFHVVPDPQKEIIKQFGVNNIKRQGIAYPSAFVVDKTGTVRMSFADEQGTRLHSSELLPVLSKITGKPAPKLAYEE